MAIRPWTIIKPILLLSVSISVLVGFFMLSQLGPRPLDEVDFTAAGGSSEEAESLLAESDVLLEQFKDVLVLRQPDEEDLALVKESIRLLDEAQRRSPGFLADASSRRQDLQRQYDDGMARILNLDLVKFEEAAGSFRGDGDLKEAEMSLRRAYTIQLKINGDYPLSSYVDVGRATRLAREITFIESEPLHLESMRLEAAAEEAFRDEQWEEARSFLRRAIQTQ